MLLGLSSCSEVAGWFGTNSDSTSVSDVAIVERDLSITPENAWSDYFLDSTALNQYISDNQVDGSEAQMMRNFYAVRNGQYAWFSSDGLTEPARGFWSLYNSMHGTETGADEKMKKRIDSLLAGDSAFAPPQVGGYHAGGTPWSNRYQAAAGSNSATAGIASSTAQTASATAGTNSATAGTASGTLAHTSVDSIKVQTELWLTHELVKLASAGDGPVTTANLYTVVPRRKMAPVAYADSLLKQPDSSQAISDVYKKLKEQLAVYLAAVKNGGWEPITSVNGFNKGASSVQVLKLKKRLQATGDYTTADTTALYSDSLVAAVQQVQQRFGLAPTGVVNDSLVAALNMPAEKRLEQIILNMQRAIWLPQQTADQWVEVNIPAQMLYAYKGNERVLEMPVIVGEQGNNTIAFSGAISQVVFNPDWNVPRSMVENEILPKMKQDKNYLQKNNMEVVREGAVPEIRQKPGKDNALGQVKFLFPNRFDIYLHDTPRKGLFNKEDRRISHGCIRVADAPALAAFVLGDAWNMEKIKAAMNGNDQQSVQVPNPKPVRISYLTAWVSPKGQLHFAGDVYGHDQQAMARLFRAGDQTDYASGQAATASGTTEQARP